MSVEKTIVSVIAVICDNCEKRVENTFIEGVSQEGVSALPEGWISFQFSAFGTLFTDQTLEACNRHCFLDLCGDFFDKRTK